MEDEGLGYNGKVSKHLYIKGGSQWLRLWSGKHEGQQGHKV